MKIQQPAQPLPVAPSTSKRTTEPVGRPEGGGGATKVSLSGDARFVERVRDEVRAGADIRQDKVDEVRKALDEGRYEKSVDLDQVVDRMLEDL